MDCRFLDRKISCVGGNVHVRCSKDLIGVICNNHCEAWFMCQLVKSCIKYETNIRNIKYISPTKRPTNGIIIPFPYKIASGRVCINSHEEVYGILNNWISKMNMSQENQCRTFGILSTLFLEKVHNNDSLSAYSDFNTGSEIFNTSFAQRFKNTKIAYIQDNTEGFIDVMVLPLIIKTLLFYMETSTNTVDSVTNTKPFNLFLNVNKGGFELYQNDDLLYYEEDKTNFSSPLIIAGKDTANNETMFVRTLMGLNPRPNILGIPNCNN